MKYKKLLNLNSKKEEKQAVELQTPVPQPTERKDPSNNNIITDALPELDKQKELIESLRKKYHIK